MKLWVRIGVDEASYAWTFNSLDKLRSGLARALGKLCDVKDESSLDEILAALRRLQ
jgi:hypothetical protein